jgi:hypothetical protein
MTTVVIDGKSRTGIRLLKEIEKHPRVAWFVDDANNQFEQDWENAISGDELVRRVHQHIDELYAQNEKLRNG